MAGKNYFESVRRGALASWVLTPVEVNIPWVDHPICSPSHTKILLAFAEGLWASEPEEPERTLTVTNLFFHLKDEETKGEWPLLRSHSLS